MFCCFVNERKKSEEYYKSEIKNYLEQINKLDEEIEKIILRRKEPLCINEEILYLRIIELNCIREQNEKNIKNLQELSGNPNLYMEVIYELADKAGVSVKKVPQG